MWLNVALHNKKDDNDNNYYHQQYYYCNRDNDNDDDKCINMQLQSLNTIMKIFNFANLGTIKHKHGLLCNLPR